MGSSEVHVVAAAIFNERGEVLITRRADDAHQGGLWEFPGGKVRPGEDGRDALARELEEELGIRPGRATPLIRVRHAYPDRRVRLEVWRVDAFTGQPHGREGQPLRWRAPNALHAGSFPAANLPIIRAVQLPSLYMISGDEPDPERWLARLDARLADGVRLVQLRARAWDEATLRRVAADAVKRAHAHGARLLVNGAPELAREAGADGVHLTAERLRAATARPLGPDHWVAASCHDADELAQAAVVGCDFAVLGPVRPTASHPGAGTLGWEEFARLVDDAALPVYALGGVGREDVETARALGAQGIAAIHALWGEGE